MASSYLDFALESSESSPWFRRLGRGVTKCAIPGSWTGTVVIERQTPDGSEIAISDPSGVAVSYTANPGVIEITDAGPLRFTFTRSSGTAEPQAWSDECLMDLPYSYLLANGDELLTEGGEYLEMESA